MFLLDPVQNEVFSDISSSIKKIEQISFKAVVKDFILTIDDDEKYKSEQLRKRKLMPL